MKPIESYPDKKHCELCGALKTDSGNDPLPDYSAANVIRRLAFIADTSPSLAILLVHHIAGRTEQEIAWKTHKPQAVIHEQIKKANKTISDMQK